jgi:hypothetical protein
LYQIAEENSYLPSVSALGRVNEIEENIGFIDYALHRAPQGFPIVEGMTTVRLAKTKMRISLSEIVPAYRLWFRIDEGKKVVHKLYLELCPPSDMAFDDEENSF